MKHLRIIFSISIFSIWVGTTAYGQGCSDAGVCTAGIMLGDELSGEDQNKFKIGLGYNLGVGDDDTLINSVLLQGNYSLSSKSFLQITLPYQMVDGNLGTTSGFGDIMLSYNHLLKQSDTYKFEGFAGVRVGTGKSDLEEGENPLPMVYQNSLGTTDLLVGLKWFSKGWSVSAGYQQPIIQYNENQFLYSSWAGTDDLSEYAESRELERKGDIVARIDKAIPMKDFTLTLGLVPIYHIQKDTYKNASDDRVAIDGSQGLTLNVSGSLDYRFSNALSANLFFGAPIVTRDVQPEGLSRTFVTGLGVFYSF